LHADTDEQGPGYSTIISQLGRRYTADRSEENLDTAAQLLTMAPTEQDLDELVRGMEEGLQGDAVKSVPPAMQERVAEIWRSRPKTPTLISFAVRLKDPDAEKAALAMLTDSSIPEGRRKSMMDLLTERNVAAAVPALLAMLKSDKNEMLRLDALNGLQRFQDDQIARTVLALYPGMTSRLRELATGVLSRRKSWARMLLEAVDQGMIAREQIPVANLISMQTYHDSVIDEIIRKRWGTLRKSSEEKEKQIAKIRRVLASGKGEPTAGRVLFQKTCEVCHTLFGEGAHIGPELTGDERDNLGFLLPAIVDPSLGIREEYTTFNLTTKDDQLFTGFVKLDEPKSVTMMDTTGHKLVIAREQIQSLRASPLSLMPEGLLDSFNDQQIRDLISYVTQKK
jgi:putative heme-binding domain-containing protein